MSEIKYGLISKLDSEILMKTVDLICDEFSDDTINFTEIGIYAGATGNALSQYIKSKNRKCLWTGIDSKKDGEVIRFHPTVFIPGDSSRVYNLIKDESQHLIIVDGLHTFAGVVSDFFCYAGKVKKGGFLAFHDCAKHINPLHGWQGIGDRNDPDFCLGGVRKALESIGLFEYEKEGVVHWVGYDEWGENENRRIKNWDLVFDEADINDEAGGFTVFQKLY